MTRPSLTGQSGCSTRSHQRSGRPGREALVILWAPASDRSFAALARQADRIIEIVPEGPAPGGLAFPHGASCREGGGAPGAQKTLEVT